MNNLINTHTDPPENLPMRVLVSCESDSKMAHRLSAILINTSPILWALPVAPLEAKVEAGLIINLKLPSNLSFQPQFKFGD